MAATTAPLDAIATEARRGGTWVRQDVVPARLRKQLDGSYVVDYRPADDQVRTYGEAAGWTKKEARTALAGMQWSLVTRWPAR